MTDRSKIIASLAAGIVAGWMLNARIEPPNDRPVLTAIARVIRNWWWVPLVLDEGGPPPDASDGPTIVGEDGYPIVQHGRSI